MMGHMNYYYNLFDAFQESLRDNCNLTAITDYPTGRSMSYLDLASGIAKMHILFEELGIGAADRIALLGGNDADCVVSYVAALTYGAVVVPIGHHEETDNVAAIIRRT
ncbi:MAG: AMP-binding protein, partial [Bacteroidales bacterium]|nr:AMP-binding protein [Bacteroidales bacterium]